MINTLILSLVALAIVFGIGLAYWVNMDARRRIRDPFLLLVATALGLVPYVGPVAYLLFRPAETRDEIRARKAEIAAFEEQLAHARPTCPECSAPMQADFRVCPVCATRLRVPCATCDAPLEPLWQTCPYCATPVEAEVDLDLDEALTREVRTAPALDLAADRPRQAADA